jgi:hypothetical protein
MAPSNKNACWWGSKRSGARKPLGAGRPGTAICTHFLKELPMKKYLAALLMISCAIAATGCSKDKANAQATYAQIETACAAKDKAKASEVAVAAYAANPVFKKAFDETYENVGADKSKANLCGIYGIQLKMRLN